MGRTREEQIAHHKQRDYLDITPLRKSVELLEDTYIMISAAPLGSQKMLLADALNLFLKDILADINNQLAELSEPKDDRCFTIAMSVSL